MIVTNLLSCLVTAAIASELGQPECVVYSNVKNVAEFNNLNVNDFSVMYQPDQLHYLNRNQA